MEYIDREAAIDYIKRNQCRKCSDIGLCGNCAVLISLKLFETIPAADVRPVVTCADCKQNNACLTQAFVEDASRVPFDRNTFFCADGKRDDDA